MLARCVVLLFQFYIELNEMKLFISTVGLIGRRIDSSFVQ